MIEKLLDPLVISAIAAAFATAVGSIIAIIKVLKELRETKSEVKNATIQVVANDRKTDDLIVKADKIHDQVNGNNSALQSKLDEANREILRLERDSRKKSEKISSLVYKKYGVDRRKTTTKKK